MENEKIEEKQIEPTKEKTGFFSKLKTFFLGDDKSLTEEQPVISPEGVVAPVSQAPRLRGECFWCKENVYENDKWSKQQNKWFHRKCYRLFLNAGRRGF